MDTVPLGRILNRFTADFNVVDSRLCNDMSFGANNMFRLVGVVVAGSVLPNLGCFQLILTSITGSSSLRISSSSRLLYLRSVYKSLDFIYQGREKQSALNLARSPQFSSNLDLH